ncbi:TetR/AcrR family transcriptional regulator [Actibacterium sp. D379-3]|jgi:AcrR family transcriptional regulator
MQERRSNADRSQETRGVLLAAARELFLEKGYAATGTPEVVERAGVTRGALYHHFKDKKALFQAIVELEATQIAAEIEQGSSGAETPHAALLLGARSYFVAMQDPHRVRLMLLDGPAILGAEVMRRIDLETGGRELRQGIEDALQPDTPPAQVDTIADLVSAMFDRAVLACNAGADARAYEDALASLLTMLTCQCDRTAFSNAPTP